MNKKLNEAYNSLSEDEKKSYNSIMAKITKVMNQITNKAQREEFMKNFKDSLKNNKKVSNKVKKLTALAISALMLVSPVMLSGCDKDENVLTPGSDITIETNKDGEVVDSISDQLANSTYKENDEKAIDINYLSYIDAPYKHFDIQKVVDGTYTNNIYDQINFWLNYEDIPRAEDSTGVIFIGEGGEPALSPSWSFSAANNLFNAQAVDSLLNKNSSYAFNVYAHSDLSYNDNSYQLIKDKDQTFCIVETKSDGTKLYNGYVNNIAFTDNLDDLNGYYPLLTSEYDALIQQADGGNASLWGQGVVACMLSGGGLEYDDASRNETIPITREGGYNLPFSSCYSNQTSTGFFVKLRTINIEKKEEVMFDENGRLVFDQDGKVKYDIKYTDQISNGPIRACINFSYTIPDGVNVANAFDSPDIVSFDGVTGIEFVLHYQDIINPNNYNETLNPAKNGYEDDVVLVGMVPTELENVQLPTSEAEAER